MNLKTWKKTLVDKNHYVRWITIGALMIFIHYWVEMFTLDFRFGRFTIYRSKNGKISTYWRDL